MARAETTKLYRTFTKGLITEASPLTYPEDASIDELNTLISRKGNRTRRLGIDYQEGYVIENLNIQENDVVHEHSWLSVNNDPTVGFTVVQVGHTIYFYDIADEDPLSASKKPFSINLLDYKIAGTPVVDLSQTPVEFSSGFGLLFIAHKFIDPLSIEYKPTEDLLQIIRIVIQVRDLEGVYDGLSNDEEPVNLSKEHLYNLQNQGWLAPGTRTIIPSLGDGVPSAGGGSTGGGSPGTYYDPYTGNERPSSPGGGSDWNVSENL